MRFLVLAASDDVSAQRVFGALRRRYPPAQVALVPAHQLASGRWSHQVDNAGAATRVSLPDGRVLSDREIGVVFNRLSAVTLSHYERATPADRDYAQFEIQALVVSWLAGLGERVVNPPAPPSLAGPQRSQCELLVAAGRAGLPVRSVHVATSARAAPAPPGYDLLGAEWSQGGPALQWGPRSLATLGRSPVMAMAAMRGQPRQLLLAGRQVIGSTGPDMTAGCRRLGQALQCPVLRVTVDRAVAGTGEWRVTEVSPLPSLGPESEVDAVLALLEARASGTEPPQ